MASIPLDTMADSLAMHIEALRKMDISARAQMMFELSDNLRSIVESGIRQRHPDYSAEEVQRAALGLTIDRALFNDAFGRGEVGA
ncbi:MAG: hypothetical protein J7M40_11785 [Planctomycetes bacterium]|nr:hypothetical protein [Planctomycetota bacterium]